MPSVGISLGPPNPVWSRRPPLRFKLLVMLAVVAVIQAGFPSGGGWARLTPTVRRAGARWRISHSDGYASMTHTQFEWDNTKAAKNLRKHQVSFDEAASVFADPLFITVVDEEHSDDEERYKIGRAHV